MKQLPQAMGRMTRLVVLNLSDNKLTDLPPSLGDCYGLAKLGAGINIERNPISDPEMVRKYQIGTDHLVDYLEKKLMSKFGPFCFCTNSPCFQIVISNFKLEEYDLAKWDDMPKPVPKKPENKTTSQRQLLAFEQRDSQLEEKLKTLKRWANTTIQQELRFFF